MALVPSDRNLAVLVAEATAEEDLTEEQRAAFHTLYRTTDQRTVAELVTTGEISPISSEEIDAFLERLKLRRINTRDDFDHTMAFVRGVTDPVHKAQIREILPTVTKTEYFLQELLRVLDGVV